MQARLRLPDLTLRIHPPIAEFYGAFSGNTVMVVAEGNRSTLRETENILP